MNTVRRKTRTCKIETLDEELKTGIRAQGTEYKLADIESNILMGCETISVHRKKKSFGGIRTTLSAMYVTRKWLVCVDSSERNDMLDSQADGQRFHQVLGEASIVSRGRK